MALKVNELVLVSLSVVDGVVTVKTKGRTPHTAVLNKTASAKTIKSDLITAKKVWATFNKSGKVSSLRGDVSTTVLVFGIKTAPVAQADSTSVAKTPAPKKAVRKPKAKTLKDLTKVIDGEEYVRLADVQLVNKLLVEAVIPASGKSNSCALAEPIFVQHK